MGATRLIAVALLGGSLLGCGGDRASLVLAATTSTYDSGLLEHVLEQFESVHPDLNVRTIVVGSGEALELGRRGDVDLVISHAPAAEARFVEEGFASNRTPLMTNDFVIVGPASDPAALSGASARDAFARIAWAEGPFVSRGDDSGTHERELAMWGAANVTPEGDWYLETGQGQATTLQVASERLAYALTDAATFHQLREILDLVPLVEGGPELLNTYSLILPRDARRAAAAHSFIDWITSEAGAEAIRSHTGSDVRRPLFAPVGGLAEQTPAVAVEDAPAAEDSTP